MCLCTFVAANSPLPEVPVDDYGFAVTLISGDDMVRPFFTMPFIYYVQGGYCGCELGYPLDSVWEDDLDSCLRKALEQEGLDPESTPDWKQGYLDDERCMRHSRRQLWQYLNAALIENAAIEVFGGWWAGSSEPHKRCIISLEEIGLEGVQGGVMATVIRNHPSGTNA